MKKNPKFSYGIAEDGATIRLAGLARDAVMMRLERLDMVEMDSPLYRLQESLEDLMGPDWEDNQLSNGEVQLNDLDSDFSKFKAAPWERMFASVTLQKGVLAVNVNEESLVRGYDVPANKAAEKAFARSQLDSRQFKKKDWQTSRFEVGGESIFMLHKGPNKLLDLISSYGRRHRKNYYYQLADANDIALSDLYRVYNLGDDERVVLVFLGREFRKAYLFDHGKLLEVFALNITQEFLEPELVFSRLSLVLDSSQQADPDKYVICGDLASEAMVEHFNLRNSGSTALLDYPMLMVEEAESRGYSPVILAQYALPIALALKAIHTEVENFTPSNFLPGPLLEAQKPFKIAWHGFLIMFLIFAVTFLGTIGLLRGLEKHEKTRKEVHEYQRELLRLQDETRGLAEIQQEIELLGENLAAVTQILRGKNSWSQVFSILNSVFKSRPYSWLTNFKQEGGRLRLNGITINRANVIAFADVLPQSRIEKVTSSQIRGRTVWAFEITSNLPVVDWEGQIKAEMEEALARQRVDTEAQLKDEEAARVVETPAPEPEKPVAKAVEPAKPKEAPPAGKTVSEAPQFGAIPTKYLPRPTPEQYKLSGPQVDDYNAFARALNSGDTESVKELGKKYLKNHRRSSLAPIVRWFLAYQLYLVGDYVPAAATIDPMVRKVDRLYPYSILLTARINHAQNGKRYKRCYDLIKKRYPDHEVRELADADLRKLGLGGE